MKYAYKNLSVRKNQGFMLIENLIAIVLLTIGAIGIAVSTAGAIKISTDNQARAMAVAAATKTLEPVYVIALSPGVASTDFVTKIRSYVSTDGAPATQTTPAILAFDGVEVQGNVAAGASETFVVSVTEAWDSSPVPKNVLTEAGPYESPITVAVLVRYQGHSGLTDAAGNSLDIKKARASFTYVLPSN